MSKEQIITIVVDAVFTIASAILGFWLAPDYKELATTIIGALQPATLAVILYFAVNRAIKALWAEIRSLRKH